MTPFPHDHALPRLDEKLARAKGKPAGFAYLRIVFALVIVCFHSIVTSYGSVAQDQFFTQGFSVLVAALQPMFFAISGFLIAGSLGRSVTMGEFLGLRLLRIFPGLIVQTLLCALVVGPWLTTLPLAQYFRDTSFWQFGLNALGYIHYTLPGVFTQNPMPEVVGQLWTLPYDLQCYFVLAGLGALGLRHRWGRLGLLVCFVLLQVGLQVHVWRGATPWAGRLLLLTFLCGTVFYLYRDRIVYSGWLGLLAALVFGVCLSDERLHYLCALPATYLTVYLGLLDPPKTAWLRSGDYSYGLFLYGFPTQQVVVALIPEARLWYINLMYAIPITLVLAVLSWHGCEQPAMRWKRWFTTPWRKPARDYAPTQLLSRMPVTYPGFEDTVEHGVVYGSQR